MSGMMGEALVYLLTALVMVPLAARLRLGSVLGYLLGGVLIGPFALNLAGSPEDVMHFAELGVVMMLFLVGLELDAGRLWRLRGPIFGMGSLQLGLTAVVVLVVGLIAGLPWQQGLALGLILAMSSTAIGLQSLAERGLLGTDAGQRSFSVLLFQDVAVIPMLAIFPLLATLPVGAAAGDGHGAADGLTESLPGWLMGLRVLAAIFVVVGGGRILVPPIMRMVARSGMRELFTVAALAIVLGVGLLMQTVGLSPALGTFLAGVVLAGSEYRHELESDVEPFKGLLLGLFFIAVGASIDLGLIARYPVLVLGAVLGITFAKGAVLLVIARLGGSTWDQGARFAVALAQVGEFAFVLIGFSVTSGIIAGELGGGLVAITALSMALSPLLFALNEGVLLPRLIRQSADLPETEAIAEHNPVILAGAGRFGQVVGRFLKANGVGVTLLDLDPEQLAVLGRFGTKVYYGDASRLDLLQAAGAAQARLLLIAVDVPEKAEEILRIARVHFPQLKGLVRARGRVEAYGLHAAGADGVFRELFGSSLSMGESALIHLGRHPHAAHRAARIFHRHDQAAVADLAPHRADLGLLVSANVERRDALERALRSDRADAEELRDSSWDAGRLREQAAPADAQSERGSAPDVPIEHA